MNTLYVPGAAGRIAIEAVGWVGTPLVLVHDVGANASHWNAISRGLRPRRVITIDLRGHGRSDRPADGRMDPLACAEDVLSAAAAHGLTRFALGGHGFGAAVVLEAAARAPDRVAALVLVAPDPALAQHPDAAPAHLRARLVRDLGRTPPDVVAAAREAARAWTPAPALARWSGPTLVLAPPERTESLVAPSLAWQRIEGTGDWLHLERPEQVIAAVEPFLAGVDPRG